MRRLLTVEHPADWQQLRQRHLTTVLDPSVVDTADLFFAGCGGLAPGEQERLWRLVAADVGALMTFVDAVLLWDELPVFAESRLLNRQPLADVLCPVLVTGEEQRACADSAHAESAHLGDAFYDGLLHDAYAQRLSTDPLQAVRIVPPRRSALLAQAATGAGAEAAFTRLAQRVEVASFPKAPTFLPLLLQEDDILTPAHLADRLMVWRTTRTVRTYRSWLHRLHEALSLDSVPDALATDLAIVAKQAGSPFGDDLAVEMGVEAVALRPARATAPGHRLAGFEPQPLPGGRHQKLLFRTHAPAAGLGDLSAHLFRLWCNG